MTTRIGHWIRQRRDRKRGQTAEDYGSLSEQERHEVDRLREEHRFGNASAERDTFNRPGT